ncbi:MAG: histidine phosphatase family protein [Acidimicrobiia bacterium]|nr:histidine phosphatase family protein [Acidimicrobiia bacterium]MBT8217573.1 histidine phosphatase family protein [Acidimicrobiia bacterium]NNL69559.1 histidine phosphatase family protein [Acidimicrobiia bacterium]
MIRLLVVRHGEAEGNREHRFIGQSDVPLTASGRRQVDLLTDRLADVGITRVVTSDLQRAAETVAPTAQRLGLEPEHDKRWREIANGEWADVVASDVAERWPDLWSRYRQGEDVLRPGGESWTDVQARAVEAVEELIAGLSEGDVVLIGTHAGPALGILRWAIGFPPVGNVWHGPFGQLHNTSISTISVPGPRLHTVNDTGHLGDPEGLFV